jgi:hypothetical protein
MHEEDIVAFAARDAVSDPLSDLLRKSARQGLQTAVETELEGVLTQFQDQRTPEGCRIVRNGHPPERAVQTGIGPVTVQVPKGRSKTGKPVTFRSALVAPCVGKARSVAPALPWLHLKAEEDRKTAWRAVCPMQVSGTLARR